MVKDQQILQEARNTVIEIFQQDPTLSLPENALLKRFVDKKSRGIALDKIS
ncbi:hypothetical protein [Pedobacter sp. NJ-S-72]